MIIIGITFLLLCTGLAYDKWRESREIEKFIDKYSCGKELNQLQRIEIRARYFGK